MSMNSSRPYMVRALYEWILENECTPYVLVNALADNVAVPQEFVKNGQIVLNVSPQAIVDLLISNDSVTFNGRFSGVPMDIFVPMSAVMGIYARENGQGMIFDAEEDGEPEPPTPPSKLKKPTLTSTSGGGKGSDDSGAKRPGLRVVK